MDPLADPDRVAPELATLLRTMEADPRPAYASGARAAIAALEEGTLIAVQTSSRRDRIAALLPGAQPVAATVGALFQCAYLRSPPLSEDDVPGWIVTQDGFRGGALVLVHEISHFRNRFVVHERSLEPAPLVDPKVGRGIDPARIAWVRAQLSNEIAARHTAWLAETGATPEGRMPAPGALFACAVKIASYPHVYNDVGVMARVVERGDRALLVAQVAAWIGGLERFRFFDDGTALAARHAEWLANEIDHAIRNGPADEAEGTL